MKHKLALTLAAGLVAFSIVTIALAWPWIWSSRAPHRLDGTYSALQLFEFSKMGQGIVVPSNPRNAIGFRATRRFSDDPLDGPAVLWDAESGFRTWELELVDGAWVASYWSPDGKAVGALRMEEHPGYRPPLFSVNRRVVPTTDAAFPSDQTTPSAPWMTTGGDAEEWWSSQRAESK